MATYNTKRNKTADIVVELIHFNQDSATEEFFRGLDRRGYRPAENHELAAYGKDHPEILEGFPTVDGSEWMYAHPPRVQDGRVLDLLFTRKRDNSYLVAAVRTNERGSR